ncbi:MAG: hypothetical protein ACKKMO_03290 [Candidatus Nealsonbacteria bacterium]
MELKNLSFNMTISEELKKGVELVPKTNLILSEFLAVIAGKKPVLTMGFHNKSEKELIKSNFPNLTLFCSKIVLGGKQQKVCAISRNKSLAKQTVEYFCNRKHHLTGLLLGYPECCIKKHLYFFYRKLQLNSPLVTYQSYGNAKGCNFLTNNLFNFSTRLEQKKEDFELLNKYYHSNEKEFPIPLWNLQFISHIPCSYDCKESIKIGREIDSLLKEYAPDTEKIIKRTLSKPILFFDLFKLVVFDGYLKNGILHYKRIIPPLFFLDDLLRKKIKKGNKIIVTNNKVEIFKDNSNLFTYQKKNEADGFILDFSEDKTKTNHGKS